MADDQKETNPKDAIAVDKLPLHLVPDTAVAVQALAHLDGALKYGVFNYRVIGVRASVYVAAARRHLAAWFNGEDFALDSNVHHLGHAIACLNILIDAQACGKLTDDRAPKVDLKFDAMTETVRALRVKHEGKQPRHYTIADIADK